MLSQFRWKAGTVWCGLIHESVLWPVHGHYECRTCGRRYPAFSDAPVASSTKRSALKMATSILLLGLALAMFPRAAEAADELKGQAALEALAVRTYPGRSELVPVCQVSCECRAVD
jgi:hypothetical protein